MNDRSMNLSPVGDEKCMEYMEEEKWRIMLAYFAGEIYVQM